MADDAMKDMPKKVEDSVRGWKICFRRNIHMYTHSLSVSKNGLELSIDCEWLGKGGKGGNAVGIWLYNLQSSDNVKSELAETLSIWANKFDVHIRLFVTKTEYIDNQSVT